MLCYATLALECSQVPMEHCYTLSHPEACRVFGDCTLGSGVLASPAIPFLRSVRHHDYPIYSSIPEFCSPPCFMFLNFVLFHVSIFVSALGTYFHIMLPLEHDIM